MSDMMHLFGMGLFGWMGRLLFPLFILAVAVLLLYALKLMAPNRKDEHLPEDEYETREALRILNERFASGEISEEEYVIRKELILRKHL